MHLTFPILEGKVKSRIVKNKIRSKLEKYLLTEMKEA